MSGSEVAATLDISRPTFARHLRGARRDLLSTLFEDGVRSGGRNHRLRLLPGF